MEINKEKIRYILQYHYDKGKNAAQTCEKICVIYGDDTLSKSAARFARFRVGNFNDVKDEPRSGRPITEKSDETMVKVKRDKCEHCGDCQGIRHRQQNSFKSFTQSWIQKEARCLGSSRVEC